MRRRLRLLRLRLRRVGRGRRRRVSCSRRIGRRVVVCKRKQRAGSRSAARRVGRRVAMGWGVMGVGVGVIARHRQEVESGLPVIRASQQRPNGVGHVEQG